MVITYSFNIITQMRRLNEDQLCSECTFLSNDLEIMAWIVADIHTFVIKSAAWEVYRAPKAEFKVGYYEIPELMGIEAYAFAGHHIKQALGGAGQELIRDLISEGVRGFVQTDCCLLLERGYKIPVNYFDYYRTNFVNTCKLMSHQDTWDWSQRQYPPRRRGMFNRVNSVDIIRGENNAYKIISNFCDSHHQIRIDFTVDACGTIKTIEGGYLRAPESLCRENSEHLSQLLDTNLSAMSRKDIAVAGGGPEGCDHLVNQIYAVSIALRRVLDQPKLNVNGWDLT